MTTTKAALSAIKEQQHGQLYLLQTHCFPARFVADMRRVWIAKAIMKRMTVLRAARDLSLVPVTPPERRHQLTEDRDEQYAVDLVHPKRLIFEVNHDPIPRNEDGGIDLTKVTAITIVEVVDYH